MTQLERLIGFVVRVIEDSPRQLPTLGRIVTITIVLDAQNNPICWSQERMQTEGTQPPMKSNT